MNKITIIFVCIVAFISIAAMQMREGIKINPEACRIILDDRWHCICDYKPFIEGQRTCMKWICTRIPDDVYH